MLKGLEKLKNKNKMYFMIIKYINYIFKLYYKNNYENILYSNLCVNVKTYKHIHNIHT